MSETIAPNAAELIDLDFFKDDTTARLLGVITALGGEVYVLKAMVNRLTVALENQGVVSAETLAEAGASEAHRAWQAVALGAAVTLQGLYGLLEAGWSQGPTAPLDWLGAACIPLVWVGLKALDAGRNAL